MKRLGIAFAFAALGLGGAAAAAPPPASDTTVRAVAWRCEGEQCGGGGPNAPSDAALLRECEKVVSVVGPVSRYVSRGRELSAHDLAQCNRRATRPPVGVE
jgi:hypothetical protein